jgi:hypothetical protein
LALSGLTRTMFENSASSPFHTGLRITVRAESASARP